MGTDNERMLIFLLFYILKIDIDGFGFLINLDNQLELQKLSKKTAFLKEEQKDIY